MGDCICDDIDTDLANPELARFRVGEPDLHYLKCPKYEPPLTMEELRLLRQWMLHQDVDWVSRVFSKWPGKHDGGHH